MSKVVSVLTNAVTTAVFTRTLTEVDTEYKGCDLQSSSCNLVQKPSTQPHYNSKCANREAMFIKFVSLSLIDLI